MTAVSDSLRVTVLGFGAIGSTVAQALAAGTVKSSRLVGVIVRRPEKHDTEGFRVISLDEALEHSDLIVECADIAAVREVGLKVIHSGTDLLVCSVGALADQEFREHIMTDGPGECFVTSGAIGGLDVLGAAARDGGLSSLSLVTTKKPVAVVQPWMSAMQRDEILASTDAVTAFTGSVREAIELFPQSLNVAVALALATNLWDELTITMIADRNAALTTHAVSASGRSGDYEFTVRNTPHPDNPATSGVVPAALLQDIERRASRRS